MKIEKITVAACCGRTSTMFRIERPITTVLLTTLIAQGFTEFPNFTKAGVLYVDNMDFILTGSLGQDRLHVRCKRSDPVECDKKLNELEGLLFQME